MQKANSSNLGQLGKNKRSLKEITSNRTQNDQKITDKEISESELQEFRAAIQEKRRQETKRKVLFIGVVAALIFSLMAWLLF